jgi:hypothetical protein
VQHHSVATPDAFWKLIVRAQDRVIAWVILFAIVNVTVFLVLG